MLHLSTNNANKRAARIIFAGFFGAIIFLICSTASAALVNPGGPIAAAQKAHFIQMTLITMIAVLPVFILVPILLWKYRYKNTKAHYDENWSSSLWLEIVMWGVPIIITIFLSYYLYHNTKDLDPYKPIESSLPPLEIEVIGLDWKWLFIYPEQGMASIGEMAFPVNRPVALTLISDTVMQSFMIGELAGQIYVMTGMKTKLHLIADKIGVYTGENTQYNGEGFAQQKFKAMSMSSDSFDAWVGNAKNQGVTLDGEIYGQLGQRSSARDVHQTIGTESMPPGVVYFDSVQPWLFDSVYARYHDGEAVNSSEQPGGASYQPTALSEKPLLKHVHH